MNSRLGAAAACARLLKLDVAKAAMALGMLWAAVPGALQAWRGSHIVITTIMFNFIAASLMAYLLVDVFKPPGSMATESKVFAVASCQSEPVAMGAVRVPIAVSHP